MKTTLIAAGLLLGGLVFAEADFGKIYAEAGKAAKAKDFAAAEAKYGEAVDAAKTSQQRCQAILGKFQAIRAQKKVGDAEKFALKAVEEDEMLKNPEIRLILNTVAGTLLWWPKRNDYAMTLLQQAQNCQAPKGSNVYYQTFYYMAHLYNNKKQYQAAIEVLGNNVLNVKEQHPANHYTANMLSGAAYEKLGKKDEALNHYKAALEAAKKVKYKFDYSPAEKAIERLSK